MTLTAKPTKVEREGEKRKKKERRKEGKREKKGKEKKKEEREKKGKRGTLENIVGAASCAHASAWAERLPGPRRAERGKGGPGSLRGPGRQCERRELANLSDFRSSKTPSASMVQLPENWKIPKNGIKKYLKIL